MANPFDILGLSPTFALEPEELERLQRELNRAAHPDRHASKGSAERRLALSRAMDVNQAYRTLRDPASRAEALFELLGVHQVSERTISDPLLLGEMLEKRELLDEARRYKDRTHLRQLGAEMQERQLRVEAELAKAFDAVLAGRAQSRAKDPELDRAQRAFAELKYIRRFREEVSAIEDEI